MALCLVLAGQRGRKGERAKERVGGKRGFHVDMSSWSLTDNYNHPVSVPLLFSSVSLSLQHHGCLDVLLQPPAPPNLLPGLAVHSRFCISYGLGPHNIIGYVAVRVHHRS